jgi:hypothetical protein
MQHWLLIGLMYWVFLSLPLCLMFGRMFSIGNDEGHEFRVDDDAGADEFY